MNLFDWIVLGYLTPAALIVIRCLELAAKEKNRFKNDGVEVKIQSFLLAIIADALRWPWYILWYGLKQFIKELQ